MASLSFKHVSKIYSGNVAAVKDFNLDIADKEFIVLVGPSGCGKSTTLRMIAGLEDISKGELFIDNNLVNYVPPKDRDISMVFQNYALYPHMTIYENMSFGLKIKKMSKEQIDRKVIEAAKMMNIEHLLKRKPKALSGGERQRAALGRAIVSEPKVFLMDEPLSNLDAKLRIQMRAEISKLHKRLQTTFIYVTHDQIEAMTMGDRIVVMKDGIIEQADSPQNIYNHPVNMFVAGFIGSPQMNFIDVKLEENQNKVWVLLGEDKIALSQEKCDRLKYKGYIGKKVIIGIRPEDINILGKITKSNSNSSFVAKLEAKEILGAETYLCFSKGSINLVARVNGTFETEIGRNIEITLDSDKVYVFDKNTEKAII